MWRLWHKLFGWHYASIHFGGDYEIARVHTDGDGRPYCRIYDHHIDLKAHPLWFPLTFPRAAAEEARPGADVIVMQRRA